MENIIKQLQEASLRKLQEESLNRFDLWVKKNKAGYYYADVHNSIVEYFAFLSSDIYQRPLKELTDEDIEDEEWHQIHDDINEERRNGGIE